MIVVDSSVWITHLRGIESAARRRLQDIEDPLEILVGDLTLLEVLQGARNERHAATIEASLRQFTIRPMLGESLAIRAARNYRLLRERGITVRKTMDLIIGTFCIQEGHSLLHDDRDFDPMAEHLGLRIA
ncbi:DNA-binding protein [Rhizobium leguminosarum bv. trifolii CB782]|uniref:Ribonuclease VapC n=1 Tax=Rhizobium hidalgonense TaxID=1538159 RepID=A0A2A6KA41_9HYPH|nr:PIN domain nuclease [Rhizobium hidalgonense]AHG44940.1 DNA-binding protein [Rhizobium leguminosarum bv. trifolii CB782]EJC73072.1 putative nucleic acid-binding protein [Rhizobium leguminosarum bv. trifolii WSM2012]MDR9775120.1 PIN domain nuclease [Rhizobium hidalgonense]MDR9806471.1 PIN domain nuclease [Rhizobium hidalgonense]MDR9813441.1 PIN domain nuclease [Rhizobium hidalgonense]